ncbi:hypothetical protein [Dickeya fangzhongdai]|uniref:hypothetical protein n=1 Tax=Dickeya fangzhongdai TaxID=1778540 RepID=UPI0004F81AD6|nr:hypothetical protein [Dickeya fangzhongdai]AIR69428.1 hypothetical protein LH89_09525 [Dickeya fangzhongdai]KGU00265.1 hypothetical protein NM75_00855 [Dickeya fangzhongdai]
MINLKSFDVEIGLGKYSWPRVIKWLLIVLVVYAICSVFISNPFSIFVDRTTPVDYSRIMYFHGLSVGLAGITALMISQVYSLEGKFKKIIFYCTILTILIGVSGGAINRSMDDSKLALWYQVLSFLALDVILITMLVGLILTENRELKISRTYYLVLAASCTAVIAALIGDLAGFILDFGDWPGILGWYAEKIGYTLPEWQDNLLRSHSDMMVVAVIGLILSFVSWKYGQDLIGNAATIKATGEWMAIFGLISLIIIMVVSGFGGSHLQIPHIFTEKGFFALRGESVAGIDLGDFVIGTFILLGGLLLIGAILFGKRKTDAVLSKASKYTISGIFFTWLSIVVTVAGMGFLEEYRADLYNSANPVPLGEYGFAFRMLHLDVSLMLFPAIMVVMLLAQHLLRDEQNKIIQWILRAGVILCSIGSLVYMVLNPKPFGPGYWIVGSGFVFVIAGMIYFFVKSDNQLKDNFNI